MSELRSAEYRGKVRSQVDGLAEVIEDGIKGGERVMKHFSMEGFGESVLGLYKQHMDRTENH